MERRAKDSIEDRLSHIAHEVKSPLSGIQSLVSLLQESSQNMTESQRHQLHLIGAFTDHLDLLTHNILYTGTYEDPNFQMNEEVLDVQTMVQDLIKLKQFAIQTHEVRLEFYADPSLPFLYADGILLRQALFNLLDNALKFTPSHGQMLIGIRYTSEGFFIKVQDSGPGIPSSAIDIALKPYVQLYKGEGLGLGLSLVKTIMDRHQGTVTLENVLEGGLLVTLKFPIVRCREQI